MSFRSVLLFLHLWAALIAGVFLLLLGVTGSFMVYESEIDHVLNRRLVAVQPTGQPLPLGELFARLEKAHPGYKVTEMVFPRQPDLAYEMYLDPGDDAEGSVVTVDQHTGRELGDARTASTFVNSVHQFHTHLLMDKHRDAAKLIVGIASIFLLFLSCSGVTLWWRRKLFRIQWSGSGKRINFDLHNVLGVFCSLFLFCFALTGIALTWDGPVNNLINRLTHSSDMPRRPRMPAPPDNATPLGPDAILAAARAALPGAEVDALSFHPGQLADLRMRFPENRTPIGRSRVFLDPYTGKAVSVWSTRTAPVGFKISRMWIREIHTGDIFGWPTRLLACVASLALPILAITGTLIWWNRGRKLFPASTDDA
ncbi:MAG TPA: PepSY-associated TM helix domain-containing protein [Candidatus Methylomirabilis sp.]|nr:PepSY-associated TM helix domain-containing protein [Candidatus Methylomirabilis sp.]